MVNVPDDNPERARPWLKYYDPGVPASLAPYPPMNMVQFMRQTASTHPRKTAILTSIRLPRLGHQRGRLTYGQLDRQSDALAAALVDMGLKKGEKVSLIMPNSANFVVAYYGVLKAGGVSAAVNPTYPPAKMQYYIDYSDARFAIVLSSLYSKVQEIRSQTKLEHIVVSNFKEYLPPLARLAFIYTQEKPGGHLVRALDEGDHWMQQLISRYRRKKPDVVLEPDDYALMQFTGGTTGVAKGALATHQALSNSTINAQKLVSVTYPPEYNAPPYDQFRIIAALPMFHVYGLVVLLSQAMSGGWEVIIVPDARDVNYIIDLIDTYRPEVFLGVPVLWHTLNNHPRVISGEVDFSCFVYAQTAAAPMHYSIKEQFEQRGGRRLMEGYGLSEVPTGNHANMIYHEYRRNSVGIPLPDVDCRIVDVDTGTIELPAREIGEVILNTPFLMSEYYKMPEETAHALRQFDGKTFMYTGDVGYVDEDGFLYLVDRKKDMAIIGGFNVYPGPVENVLKNHPSVADAGVWGIPHPKVEGQEALQAWVVLRPGQRVKTGDLIKYCKDYLAPYEIPRRILLVDKLPYSPVGKLLRRELISLGKAEGKDD